MGERLEVGCSLQAGILLFMSKPILFHDIDGVLFGHYDGAFQLRPGVSSWLKWAHEHFEIVWLTSWDESKVKSLLEVLYLGEIGRTTKHAKWMGYAHKPAWLSEALPKLAGREWFWIDDDVESYADVIEGLKLPKERCIQVDPKGRLTLEALQEQLAQRISNAPQTADSLH